MTKGRHDSAKAKTPTARERAYLNGGLDQPGGKLPLFDRNGQTVSAEVVRACIDRGWAEPWFSNPLKPEWLVCRLTEAGRRAVENDSDA